MKKRGLNCVFKLFMKPAWTVQANASDTREFQSQFMLEMSQTTDDGAS